jgi:FMN phosphatase YigB (HAD superfamily)
MQNIKNIIFDYGNVIFEINFKKAQDALFQLGITDIEAFFSHKKHNTLFDDFETAAISEEQFRQGIRDAAGNPDLSDEQIDAAWNSLLIGVPANNHDTLLKVKAKYRSFLLSNNNVIHCKYIVNYLAREFGLADNSSLFEKTYYSQDMLLRKPHVQIFQKVIEENNLIPEETLFIDDSPQHLVGAKQAGFQTLLMDVHPRELGSFLERNKIL